MCHLSSWPTRGPSVSPLVHSLNKSFPCYYLSLSFCIATAPPCFPPYGDVMETKYCKTVNSALTPVPCSYQHQPLSKRSKKNNLSMKLFVHVNSLIFMYCAMKSWPCPSFLCSRIHSCCTVSELSLLWVFVFLKKHGLCTVEKRSSISSIKHVVTHTVRCCSTEISSVISMDEWRKRVK